MVQMICRNELLVEFPADIPMNVLCANRAHLIFRDVEVLLYGFIGNEAPNEAGGNKEQDVGCATSHQSCEDVPMDFLNAALVHDHEVRGIFVLD